MNKAISRYEKLKDGRLAIDISILKYAELYDEWDNTASYIKKDLDADLADFLYDCFFESKKSTFVIRIKSSDSNKENQAKVKKSIKTYFEYMAQKELQNLRNNMHMTVRHFILGFVFIISSIIARKFDFNEIVKDVVIEGMIILGWVTLWKVFTGILYEWNVINADIKIYDRISKSEVIFVEEKHK